MQQETVTLVVAGLGIAGTLGGVVSGHFLTRSWQKKQWLLDCRKEEFRELLATLTAAQHLLVFPRPANPTEEWSQEIVKAHNLAMATIRDRLYIAVDMERLDVFARWCGAITEFYKTQDTLEFSDKLVEIRKDLLKAATGLNL